MIDESRIHVMINEEELEKRFRELGEQISRDYAGKEKKMKARRWL